MKLSDITTIRDLARKTNINFDTLFSRVRRNNIGMISGEDFLKLGPGQPVLLSPSGVEKILLNKRRAL